MLDLSLKRFLLILSMSLLFQGCSQNLIPDESLLSPNLIEPPPIVGRPQSSDISEPIFGQASTWDTNHPFLFGFEYMNVDQAWSYLPADVPSLTIAVIDTGIDTSHPEFENRLWINSDEIPGNGQDDDGNGYVDDVHGYNFVAGNGNVSDDNGHGSHVSGTIAAALNGQGIMGIAPFVRVMVLKAMDENGSGSILDVLSAIEYAGENGADIVNLSLGLSRSQVSDEDFFFVSNEYDNVIDRLHNGSFGKSIASVVSSGNFLGQSTRNITPANARRAFAVSAHSPEGDLCGFSSDGWKTDISMPGCGNGVPGILSVRSFQCGESNTIVCNLGQDLTGNSFLSSNNDDGSKLSRASGTSQAAPHAAGLLALGMAKRPDAHPELLRQGLRRAAPFYQNPDSFSQTLNASETFGAFVQADTFLQRLDSQLALGRVGVRFTSPRERPTSAGSNIQIEAELFSDQENLVNYDIVQFSGSFDAIQSLDLNSLSDTLSNSAQLNAEGRAVITRDQTLSPDPYDLFIIRAAHPSDPERHFYDFLVIEKP